MIELDEEALEIAASTVELEDEDFLDRDEAAAIRLAQARKIVTSYMTELAFKPSFANPIAHAAELAEQRSDFWREKATVWAVQNQELAVACPLKSGPP